MRLGFSRRTYCGVAALGTFFIVAAFLISRESNADGSKGLALAPPTERDGATPAFSRKPYSTAARLNTGWPSPAGSGFSSADSAVQPWIPGDTASTDSLSGPSHSPWLLPDWSRSALLLDIPDTTFSWAASDTSHAFASGLNLATLPLSVGFASAGGSGSLAGPQTGAGGVFARSAGGSSSGGGSAAEIPGVGGRQWATDLRLPGVPVGLLPSDLMITDPVTASADAATAAVTPLPAAVWAGLALLTCLGAARRIRGTRDATEL